MHEVGVASHRGRLIGLKLPDEVPPQVEVTRGRRLGGRLLIAVLAEVAYAECGEAPHVFDGPRLADDDERHVTRITTGDFACRVDASSDNVEVLVELLSAVVGRHPLSRMTITPTCRPVVVSRR